MSKVGRNEILIHVPIEYAQKLSLNVPVDVSSNAKGLAF